MANLNARATVKANRTRAQLIQELAELLLADFKINGAAAIATVRTELPATYLRLIATLRPGNHETNLFEELTDEQLVEILAELKRIISRHISAFPSVHLPDLVRDIDGMVSKADKT